MPRACQKREEKLASLIRFIARHGEPDSILDDNAKENVGTCNKLSEFLRHVAQQGIKFTFASHYSLYFNSIVEVAVSFTSNYYQIYLILFENVKIFFY